MRDRETPAADKPESVAPEDQSASDVMASTLAAIQQLAALQRNKRKQEEQP